MKSSGAVPYVQPNFTPPRPSILHKSHVQKGELSSFEGKKEKFARRSTFPSIISLGNWHPKHPSAIHVETTLKLF